jgi:hypothetical protein
MLLALLGTHIHDCGSLSAVDLFIGEMHFIPSNSESRYNLPRTDGISYAPQESWVLNDTIKASSFRY